MEEISRDIIEQAQTGNIEAFERIYTKASGFVYNVALRITNNRQEAQEVTQDVFLKIYHNLKDFQFRSSFKTWLYRITVNTALNAYKRISKETKRRIDFDKVIDTQAASIDSDSELTEQEELKQQRAHVESLLTVLNPQQKACIILREIQGLSYKQISQSLNINLNTVRSRLKRARETLLAYATGGSLK
jgi:RNA polymerase sigma-70 factor (ECF subfamily)